LAARDPVPLCYLVACVSAALVGAGCARPGPPGGGPPDTTPPEVVRTLPADGETHVDPATNIEIEFSEEMNRVSAERALTVAPAVSFRKIRWRGRSLIVEPAGALPDSTTFVVRIGGTARDYHEVAAGTDFSFAFSTGDVVDSGTITGVVTLRGGPVSGATVWACLGKVRPDTLGVLAPCGYAALTSDDGSFRFDHVRAAAEPYALVGFIDRDGDGTYSTQVEPGGVEGGAATIASPGDSVGGLKLAIGVPAPEERE